MADGGRLLAGGLIVLFVIIVNLLTAFITTSAAATAFEDDFGCAGQSNVSNCEEEGETDFFAEVAATAVTGIEGAPGIVNACYVVTMGFLFAIGLLLIALSFAPLTS